MVSLVRKYRYRLEAGMDFSFFVKGFVVGLLVAVPVGPVGVVCVHRLLTRGKLHGLVSGFGAATADAVWAAVVVFGLTLVSNFLTKHEMWFHVVGGIFLCVLGVRTFFSKERTGSEHNVGLNHIGNYGSAFLITIMNPVVVLAFAAVFAGLEIVSKNHVQMGLLIGGVFAGSAAWWVVLSAAAGIFNKQFNASSLNWLHKVAGVIIIGFGLFVLLNLWILK